MSQAINSELKTSRLAPACTEPIHIDLAFPSEIWKNIIVHLLDVKSMKNLSQTSRRMHTIVNDPYITRLFLYALAKKRGDSPEVIATELGTRSGHAFLENYILEVQLDNTYQTTQKISSLLRDLFEEVNFLEKEAREKSFKIKPFYSNTLWHFNTTPSFLTRMFDDRCKTSAEFFIYCGQINMLICHPFGFTLVKPFPSCVANPILIAEFAEAFINRVQATFQGFCTYETLTSGETNPAKLPLERTSIIQEVLRPAACGDRIRRFNIADIQELSREDLPRKKGSKHLIIASQSKIFSVYKIEGAFENSLPSPQFAKSDKKYYSLKLMRRVLTILEKRFGKISNP